MITFPSALKAVGGARTGIAPANLLDVLDVNNNAYYWSDRPINAPTVLSPFQIPGTPGFPLSPPITLAVGQFAAWSFPTSGSVTGDATIRISGNSASGTVNQQLQGPFTPVNRVTFSNFSPYTLPPGAIVDAVYLVVNYNATPVAPQNDAGITSAALSGQVSGLISGVPGPGSSFYFEYQDTVPPTPGTPGYLSPFVGLEARSCTISSIAACTIYHLPAGAFLGGGGSLSPINVAPGFGPYLPWIMSVPQLKFNRSLQTDFGKFVLQNLSGDTLSRDFEKIMRRSALEGAFFIYRLWQPDVRVSWIEMHGTFTVDDVGVDTVSLKGAQLLNPAQENTPLEIYSETCQLQWGGRRCGAGGATECQYSYQSCQVVERIMVALNDFEKNYGEATASLAVNPVNRRRKF